MTYPLSGVIGEDCCGDTQGTVMLTCVRTIIESVDSICRDGADTPISPIQK